MIYTIEIKDEPKLEKRPSMGRGQVWEEAKFEMRPSLG